MISLHHPLEIQMKRIQQSRFLVFLKIVTILLMPGIFAPLGAADKQQHKKRVAILDFTAENTTKTYANAVRNLFEVELHKTSAFDIVERNQMETILNEQGMQMSGCIDTACAVQIGKMLSAELIVTGSVSKIDGYAITVKFVNVGKGKIEFADSVAARSDRELQQAVATLAGKIAKAEKTSTALHGEGRGFSISLIGGPSRHMGEKSEHLKPTIAYGLLLGYDFLCSSHLNFSGVLHGFYLYHRESSEFPKKMELALSGGHGGIGLGLTLANTLRFQIDLLAGYASSELKSGVDGKKYSSGDMSLMALFETRLYLFKGVYVLGFASYQAVLYSGSPLQEMQYGGGLGYVF